MIVLKSMLLPSTSLTSLNTMSSVLSILKSLALMLLSTFTV
ncbi:secreted protein [Bathymodiolus azoricus thioautotrophic gill symbiont]|uniref:Secreted protein n=1 Tax=Bathymodiolus azoricus thioautotrophic gill symbiont TaxID=235205 RepID=A0A1H6KLN4_9GAMM|nr:secreted protein [Bathymodiolus azoricus thioautotrophic gill symbiont]